MTTELELLREIARATIAYHRTTTGSSDDMNRAINAWQAFDSDAAAFAALEARLAEKIEKAQIEMISYTDEAIKAEARVAVGRLVDQDALGERLEKVEGALGMLSASPDIPTRLARIEAALMNPEGLQARILKLEEGDSGIVARLNDQGAGLAAIRLDLSNAVAELRAQRGRVVKVADADVLPPTYPVEPAVEPAVSRTMTCTCGSTDWVHTSACPLRRNKKR